MKLAFNSKAHHPDYTGGYERYSSRGGKYKFKMYRKIIRRYCEMLASRLLDEGMVDLPGNLGSIAAAEITRKPIYKNGEFVGYGRRDWRTGEYDGSLKAFGMVYLPRTDRNNNLRCLGFVANRELFTAMKKRYLKGEQKWELVTFDDSMI